MKKYIILLSLITAAVCIGCKNKPDEIPSDPVNVEDFIYNANDDDASGSVLNNRPLANEAAVLAAFTLDYRPLKAEAENEAETLSAADLSGTALSSTSLNSSASLNSGGQGNIVGGGLRALSEYKTVYFDPAGESARIQAIRAAQEAGREGQLEGANEPLTVIDWGPRGNYSSAIQRPSIYVIFSQSMIPIASLGESSSTSQVVSINPPIKGSFRWYGTNFLSFEGDEPCQSQQTYTITVASNAQSLSGNRISGERTFSFLTETLSIKSVVPGEEYIKNNNLRFDNNNVPPLAARQISLEFNYPVQLPDINEYLEITAGNESRSFSVKQENEYKITAELTGAVDFDTRITVVLKRGARSRGGSRGTEADQRFSFRTPGPFVVNSHNRSYDYGRLGNFITITFSHSLNESTVRGKINCVPAMTLTNQNSEVRANRLILFNLPVNFNERIKINIAAGIEDVYGRKLSSPYSCEIVMPNEPPPSGEARFIDYREYVMLEAQFPPRFLFEYQNIIPNSGYRITSSSNPWRENWDNASAVDLISPVPNTRYFENIDLLPYLNAQGRGFVNFFSDIQLLTSYRTDGDNYRTGTSNQKKFISIQVTDLGVTARYAFNKAAVLVTSISTGKPVEGALVSLLSPALVKTAVDVSFIKNFAEAVTDSNGFAVLNLDTMTLRNNTVSDSGWRGYEEPFIFVKKNTDKALFNPSSHNNWRFGINSGMSQRAQEITPHTFLFSDRGLYKPGEVLTFRGVDRSLVLGMYAVYQGEYTVVLEEDSYGSQQTVTINGETSESGSFYGSIKIPEDLTPGSYRLIYKRSGNNNYIANVPITVAFFERLKFQASLSSPPAAVIIGDDINLNLSAGYLSGGSLSGAEWEGAWFEETTGFYPGKTDTKGYIFGPRRGWDSKRFIGSENGNLNGQGSATLSQKTGGSKITGAPYLYTAEARVTDISNQMVAASRSVVAHPAVFYIGLSRSIGSFVRAGQEFSCSYITVNIDGERMSNNALFLQSGEGAGQIKVELIREEYRRAQQRGVSGYINDEYSRHEVVDGVQMINIQNGGGAIRVKPVNAGYHILRVSSKDREGRTALSELGFYVTGAGGYWNMNNPTELRLTPDQEMYEPGDTAKVLLQSALPEGYYLITVEREGIFTEEVRHFTESISVIDIPIARNYVPVVYVSVSSYSVRSGPPVHEYGTPDLDKPKGYFGVTRLNVNPRVKAFSVSVQSDKKTYRPGDEVTMTLTAARDGRPLSGAELTLMAVDRGVLDLINYHVPDPIKYFYSQDRFSLYVAGGDSRDMLMDPVTYAVLSQSGGDDGSKIEERVDFNPTAVFEPMLITGADGKVTCKFTLPDNLTTYRVTVFGVRGDLFALKESEIAAQNRINVREILPRRLRERDTAEAGVLITNLDSSSRTLTVKLDVGSPLANDTSSGLAKTPGQAFVDGTAERRVTVKSGENTVVYFDVAAVKEGIVTLNFTITSDILNEKLIREMIIEHPYVMETFTTTGVVEGNSGSEGLVIPSFADNGAGSLTLTLDATRLSLLDSAVTYLFRYPYGCLEQRSSAIMPLVVFGEYLDALSLKSEVSNPRRVVENELRSWANYQLSGGGFPYWPSGIRVDFYVSLRIAHIIAIAKTKGMTVPSSLNVTALVAYLNREYQEMQRWQNNSSSYYYQSYLQSYMLYVFSLLNERVDASKLAEILGRDNVDASVLAFTGMTYRAIGRNADAASTALRLRNLIRMTTRGADITDPLERSRYNYYGNKVEQLSLALQFFADQYKGDDINTRLLFSLLETKRAGNAFWQSTAETVRVLCAVDALIRAEDLTNIDLNAAVTLAGTELLKGAFKGLGAKPVTQTFDFSNPAISGLSRDRMHPLNFTRSGRGNIYYTASLRYAIPTELQSFRDEGIGIFLSLYDINTGQEIKGTALQSGKTYRAVARVSSSRDRAYLALRVPVPSGAEILDTAFVTTSSYGEIEDSGESNTTRLTSWLSHQYIMDNEIQYFWDRFNKGESSVSFLFRTARKGVYPTPPAQAECMYESEIFGRTKGLIYTIE